MLTFSAGDGTPPKIWDSKGLRTLGVDDDPIKQEQRAKLYELVPDMPTQLEVILDSAKASTSLTEEEAQDRLWDLWAEGKVAKVGDKLYQKMPRAGGGGSRWLVDAKWS